ncbi:MAG: DUF4013 domain-containing protein [Halobacteriales archaeon]
MEPIGDAVQYPMNRSNWLTTVIIGGLLWIFSFLLIPLFFVYGIAIRAMQRTMAGDDEPPQFEDWGELLVDGVQAWLIGLIYTIIPLVLMWFIVGTALVGAIVGGEGSLGAAVAGALFGVLIVSIIALVFGYVASIAVVNFAREGTFGAGFDFDVIGQVVTSTDYLIAFIVVVVLFFVVGIVTAIPLIGWIIAPFLTFYLSLVAARILAGGFEDALASA